MNTQAEVQAALERKLKRPLNAEVWVLLLEDGYVSEVMQREEGAWPRLVARYRKLERLAGKHRATEVKPKDMPPDYRAVLVSRLQAHEAAQLPKVREFRRAYLPDGLLKREDVEAWLEAHADGKPSEWVCIPLPKGYEALVLWDAMPPDGMPPIEVVPPVTLGKLPPDGEKGWYTLGYIAPDGWTKSLEVSIGGILDKLRRLSEHLAHRYNWLEAQATDFVLTGSAPVVYPITVRVKRWRGITPPHIILDIDAATAPKDVLQAYTEIRRQLIGGKRHRPRSEKVAHLVAFVLKHQGPWLERMGLWNRTYPQWAYESERVMARDYHRAAQGLLQP